MLKVLLLEDCQLFSSIIAEPLTNLVKVLHADSIQKGRDIFDSQEVDAVIIGICMIENSPSVALLVADMLEQKFRGPIIASFDDPADISLIQKEGATHVCDKYTVAPLTLDLLGF